jgi:hypothetical protein
LENERDISHECTIDDLEGETILDFGENADDFIVSMNELN